MWSLFPRIPLTALLLAASVSGGVVKVEVQSRADVLGGQAFGLADDHFRAQPLGEALRNTVYEDLISRAQAIDSFES